MAPQRGFGLGVLLWVPGAVLADLPVHCVRTQIAGRWRFYSSRPTAEPQDCGHHTPGTISDVLLENALSTMAVAFDEPVLDLELESPDLARTTGSEGADELGWWTMVYDEGFEVRIKSRAFFAFSSLQQAPRAHTNATQTWTSRCDRTAVGWYRSSERPLGGSFGCYYGVQLSPSGGSSSSSKSGGGDGDGGRSDYRSSSGGSGGGSGNGEGSSSSSSDDDSGLSSSSVGGGGSSSSGPMGGPMDGPVGAPIGASRRPPPAVRSSEWPIGALVRALREDRPDVRPDAYAGLPERWDWRDVHGLSYVPPVRSQGSCGSCYASATVAMLEARLAIASGGRVRPRLSVQEVLECSPYSQGCGGGFPYLVGKYLTDAGVVSDMCFPTRAAQAHQHCTERCQGPAQRWRATDYRYVGGRYGSCSEAAMMIEIYTNGPVVAGFEATSALYLHDGAGVFSEAAAAAEAASAAAKNASARRVNAEPSWEPRGTWDAQMVEHRAELIVQPGYGAARAVSVDRERPAGQVHASRTPSGLHASASSLHTSSFPGAVDPPSVSPQQPVDTRSDFKSTNHAVLIVGWGVLDGTKYWLAQNTWGPQWASGGYFRMRRGSDDSAVESMVVAVDVDGALPLPSMELVDEADDTVAGLAVRGALRRLTFRRQQLWRSLKPNGRPPEGPPASETPPLPRRVEEPNSLMPHALPLQASPGDIPRPEHNY